MPMPSLAAIQSRPRRVSAPAPVGGGTPTYISAVGGAGSLIWGSIASTDMLSTMVGYTNPGVALGGKLYITSYSGATVDETNSVLHLLGGGHNDYAGNEELHIDLTQNAPAWVLSRFPTVAAFVTANTDRYADNKPASRHTYWGIKFIASLNKVFIFGGGLWAGGGAGGTNSTVNAWDVAANDYDSATYTSAPSGLGANGGTSIGMDANGDVWNKREDNGAIQRWNRSAQTWTTFSAGQVYDIYADWVLDPVRNRLVQFDTVHPRELNPATGTEAVVSHTGPQASVAGNNASVFYCTKRGSFLLMKWSGTTVYEGIWNGSSYVWNTLSIGGTPPASPVGDGTSNLYGRWANIPALEIAVHIRGADTDIKFFRY